MARIRTVKPQFFRHRKLYLAEQETGLPLRVAFAGLWTCADREGRFRWEPDELKLDCLPYDNVDFSRVMHALFTRGFVVRYASQGKIFGVIPSFREHQIVNNREAESGLPVPPDNIEELIEIANKSDASCTREPRDTIQIEGNRKGKEGKGTGTELGTRDTRPSELFENFKREYPKREGAQPWKPAEIKFLALVKSGIDPDEIIAGAVQSAIDARRQNIIGTSFVPQAVTWLNQQRWADHAEAAKLTLVASEAIKGMFYAKDGSEQLAAWDEHYIEVRGRGCPRDKKQGWMVPAEWPPYYVQREPNEPVQFVVPRLQSI